MSEENTQDHSSQFSLDYARNNGLRIVLPTAFELQVDIDNNEAFAQFQRAYDLAATLGMVSECSVRPSKSSGERRHVTVKVPLKITPLERIALQAIFGSDWRREPYSLERLRKGDAVPTSVLREGLMPNIRVVHVRKAPFDLYIGRAFAEFPASNGGTRSPRRFTDGSTACGCSRGTPANTCG